VSPRQLILRSVLTFVSLAGVATGLTWLFLGMRAVMRIGGSCGSGGPYEIETPCPEGVPLVMVGGIFGGLICLAVYAIKGLPFGPRLTLLAWPALFLSLGWNFFEFGLKTPGLSYSFLFCGVLSAVMGGGPLLLFLQPSNLRAVFAAQPTVADPAPSRSSEWLPGKVTGRLDTGDAGAQPDDLAYVLERMAALHASGKLTDEEFAAAKRRLLGTDNLGEAR